MRMLPNLRTTGPFLAFSMVILFTDFAFAQDIAFPFAAVDSPLARGPMAVAGEPFGVLVTEIPLPPASGNSQAGGDSSAVRVPRVLVSDPDGRVFYPVVTVRNVEVVQEVPVERPRIGRPGGLIDRLRSAVRGEAEKKEVPVALRVAALFRGEGNLTLEIKGDINQRMVIVPREPRPELITELLSQWWGDYVSAAQSAVAGGDIPKLLHEYLISMLANRLTLPRVELEPKDPDKEELSQPLQTLALLAAIEPLREEILKDVLAYPEDLDGTDLAVPSEPVWDSPVLPPIANEAVVESIATRVPPECFYLRFGSFSNYVWFQELSERFGGDIGQAVLLRGFNYEASAKLERMLASKLTAVGKMFGDKLVSDMALVGSDLYLREGASIGVVFLATNPGLLKSAFDSDRRAVLAKNEDASLREIEIAGRNVSFLSTPDNRIRSFFVADGEYFFVSTSEALVRRFIEVGSGAPSLAAMPAFRWARAWMPEESNYAVFGYFSPDFFHRLVSPQYQIELRRRLGAVAHLEIAEAASMAAASEGLADVGIEDLRLAGFVPTWFDDRADGSLVLRDGDRWIDSTRGARGSFLPIADVEITHVTEAEADRYARIANFYQGEWRHMDPMLIGLRRFQVEGQPNREQVAFEGYLAPFDAGKYGWVAQQLAGPSNVEMQLPADDAISVQLHVQGTPSPATPLGDYHLFGGIKDMLPPDPEDAQGLIRTLQALRAAPAYIGAWPKPGLIEQLPLGLGLARPDYAGFSRMIGGLWRWQSADFSLLSFNRSILDQAIPQLGINTATDQAQVRVRVADLSGSQLAQWINKQWYQRGSRSSHGNALLLDTLHQQLKVPAQDCLGVSQSMLDVKLQCPLGGEFVFDSLPLGDGGWWTCTAWPKAILDADGNVSPPPDYNAPWIEWFRGCQVHLTQQPDSLAVVGTFELDLPPLRVQVEEETPALLPPMNFDLFELPFKLFGDTEKQQSAGKQQF